MQHRRRAPRVQADWPATWTLYGPGGPSGQGVVLDVSLIGFGLEVLGPPLEGLVGRGVTVEAPAVMGSCVNIRLAGQVVRQDPYDQGTTRVGVEFLDLSESEQSVLNVMRILRVSW